MNIKKRIFDVIFIVVTAVIMLVLNQHDLISEYPGFSLFALILAYYMRQFVEKKTKAK